MSGWRVVAAFLRRDALRHSSYRLSFLLSLGQLLVTTLIFFYIARLIPPQAMPALAPYGGDYLAFVVLGLGMNRYMNACLSGLGNALRAEQLAGTLEAVLVTPASWPAIGVGAVLWDLAWTTLEVGLYFAFGIGVFHVPLAACNPLSAAVLFLLALAALSGLGVLAACGVLVVKEFDPVGWVLGGLSRVLSGVYFPVALLPGGLQAVAWCLPMTAALEGLRRAVLQGASLASLSSLCAALFLFIVCIWPLAVFSLRATLTHLQRTGALNFR